MTKNRTPTPVYLDPGMHSGLEVKGLILVGCMGMGKIVISIATTIYNIVKHDQPRKILLSFKVC